MSKKLRSILLAAAVLAIGIGAVATRPAAASPKLAIVSAPVTVFAAPGCPAHPFFGLDPWYKFMDKEFDPGHACEIKCFNLFPRPAGEPNDCNQTDSDVPGILLVVIDDLLRIAGLVAIGFVLVGAFQYVESRGNSERAAKAQSSIRNALVGLVVAMTAVAFIAFLGDRLV